MCSPSLSTRSRRVSKLCQGVLGYRMTLDYGSTQMQNGSLNRSRFLVEWSTESKIEMWKSVNLLLFCLLTFPRLAKTGEMDLHISFSLSGDDRPSEKFVRQREYVTRFPRTIFLNPRKRKLTGNFKCTSILLRSLIFAAVAFAQTVAFFQMGSC